MELTTRSDSSASPGPIPRPAATVVPVREGSEGPEVLLTVRPHHMRFMGGASVFPGGAVAESDLDPGWERASAISASSAARSLGIDDPPVALGAYVCALREAFEEVGLLLARGPVNRLTPADAGDPGRWLARCLEEGIVLATDELVPAGRWVTPSSSPIRFDARFFLARVPGNWVPDPDPSEVEECRWRRPSIALEELARGEALMAPPTIAMLQRLSAPSSITGMMEALRARGIDAKGGIVSAPLGPGVHVVLAPNPGLLTGPGTNTYVVGSGPRALVDPAVDDYDYLSAIDAAADGEVDVVLVTHRHPDHIGGVAAVATVYGAPVRAFGTAPVGARQVQPIADGEEIGLGDDSLIALHTPGHASDHLCFFAPRQSALFAGDNVLGEGTAVIAPPDGDMEQYLASLRRMRELRPRRIYPGHFRPLDDGVAAIEGYLAHREARERAIVEVLQAGPATVDEIVQRVYAEVSEELHPIARFTVVAHLQHAKRKGTVESHSGAWRLRGPSR